MRVKALLGWTMLMIVLTNGCGSMEAGASWQASPAQVEELAKRQPEFTYRESEVPDYTLPDPLTAMDGSAVTTAEIWREKRRPEILEQFKTHVYGRAPLARPAGLRFDILEEDRQALDGLALRKQVRMIFSEDPAAPRPEMLIYLPVSAAGPVPLFLALNFRGNHTVWPDPQIHLADIPQNPGESPEAHRQRLEKARGERADRFPIPGILSRGYGLATIYYEDLVPDNAKITERGLRHAFAGSHGKEDWGAIAAWAWGLQRALDYCETDGDIDHRRVSVLGHSRLGKTALWAGALDERFAMVVSNDSGCGGAALSRRHYGETVKRINTSFPHWFCDNFKQYNDNEAALPVDQHMLIALMAPRPVCVGSADQDLWADPHGEFLACLHASPVYERLGVKGLCVKSMPGLEQPVQKGHISYHIRSGKHDLTEYDWQRYMDFADRHLEK
jgi:hypothetical protein